MIVIYVLGAWLGVALLLAWPVGALLRARPASRLAGGEIFESHSVRWTDVEVPAS